MWTLMLHASYQPVSGGKANAPLRTELSKTEFYNNFKMEKYPMVLDKFVHSHPDEVKNIQLKHKHTRFDKNIIELIAWKTKHKVNVINRADLEVKDRAAPELKFVCYETFFKHLKKQHVKLVYDHHPYHCPTCLALPDINKNLETLKKQCSSSDADGKELDLQHQIKLLERKVINSALHQRQLEIQRAAVAGFVSN